MRETEFRAWAIDFSQGEKNTDIVKRMFYKVGCRSFNNVKWKFIVETSKFFDYGFKTENDQKNGMWWFDFDARLMQFIGLTDKNEKKIFEGDILISEDDDSITYYVVKYGTTQDNRIGFYMESNAGYQKTLVEYFNTMKIIGNIYENPELINEHK